MYSKKIFLIIVVIALTVFLNTGCISNETKLSGEEIFDKLSVSTVEISAESDYVSSLGTGFFIDDRGTVVTNYHVIADCSSATITIQNGRSYKVTGVLGYDKDLDIAILSTSKRNSTAVETCHDVSTGEPVYVLGSSLGLTGTFSEGLVSNAERDIDNNIYIQISAPISPGNSGGPVVNALGEVIGIASAGFEEGQNLNLALPISILDEIAINDAISMEEFFENTSSYYQSDSNDQSEDRVVVLGSSIAIRTISLEDLFTAEFVLELWKLGDATEETMIEMMDEFGAEQGGGQLYWIDRGVFVEEIETWCFDHSRKPGDYAIIENIYGYSICYFSMANE